MASVKESNSAETVALQKISEALKATDKKKQNLRQAFECLQSHSSSLASFTLQWKDLEDYFNSIQKSLEERFKELETKEKQKQNLDQNLNQKEKKLPPVNVLVSVKEESKELSPLKVPELTPPIAAVNEIVPPEMKSCCLKMDGIGLRTYIMNRRKEPRVSREEVAAALKYAPDPAKLVLDATPGFFAPKTSKKDRGGEVGAIRRTCVLLMEELLVIRPEVKNAVKMEARNVALEWRKEVMTESDDQLEALAFLLLVAIYGVSSEFNANEIVDLLVSVARRKQAVDIGLALNIKDKVPGLIEKLISKGKQLDAVKFAYGFGLLDKFPPVPLLNAYLKESKKVAQEVRKKGNNSLQSLNEANSREAAYLKAMVKFIEEHQLESEFSQEGLDKRIEQLEKQKASRKRPALAPASAPASASVSTSKQKQKQKQKPKQKQPQLNGNKRPRPAPSNTSDVATQAVASASQMHPVPSSLLSDQVSPYLNSSAHYSLRGTVPDMANYNLSGLAPNVSNYSLTGTASSIAHHGLRYNVPQYLSTSSFAGTASDIAQHGLQGPPSDVSHYLSTSSLASSIYDRSTAYGGSQLFPSHGSSSFYR